MFGQQYQKSASTNKVVVNNLLTKKGEANWYMNYQYTQSSSDKIKEDYIDD